MGSNPTSIWMEAQEGAIPCESSDQLKCISVIGLSFVPMSYSISGLSCHLCHCGSTAEEDVFLLVGSTVYRTLEASMMS